jgi:hypothetical protein
MTWINGFIHSKLSTTNYADNRIGLTSGEGSLTLNVGREIAYYKRERERVGRGVAYYKRKRWARNRF